MTFDYHGLPRSAVDEIEPEAAAEKLVGRTIVRADLEPAEGYGNNLTLWFDDGSVARVAGWGHDWFGTDVHVMSAAEWAAWRDYLERAPS